MLVKIIKNKTVVDANNQFTYIVECVHNGKIDRTSVKVPANVYMLPDESVPNITNDDTLMKGWLGQLSYEYNDIDIHNYTVTVEEV